MSSILRYYLEDGSELLIEIPEVINPGDRAGIGGKIETARVSFDDALNSVRLSALQIRKKLHDVQADEVEVKFGLKATGEIGNNLFAVGKAGIEANYEVTLKWKKEALSPEFLHKLDQTSEKKNLQMR